MISPARSSPGCDGLRSANGASARVGEEVAQREEWNRVDVVERVLDDDEARAEQERDEDEGGCRQQLGPPVQLVSRDMRW